MIYTSFVFFLRLGKNLNFGIFLNDIHASLITGIIRMEFAITILLYYFSQRPTHIFLGTRNNCKGICQN